MAFHKRSFVEPVPYTGITESVGYTGCIGVVVEEELFLMTADIFAGVTLDEPVAGKIRSVENVARRVENHVAVSISLTTDNIV